MAQDESRLSKYEPFQLSVLSSTQISTRTASIIAHLTAERGVGEKPVVVSLSAKAKVASKLVSIVEIAKRELASKGVKCYQYNALASDMVDVPREPKKRATVRRKASEGAEDESDDAFETMGAPPGTVKKRNVPMVTIYLSKTPVKELRAEYGYVCCQFWRGVHRLTCCREQR